MASTRYGANLGHPMSRAAAIIRSDSSWRIRCRNVGSDASRISCVSPPSLRGKAQRFETSRAKFGVSLIGVLLGQRLEYTNPRLAPLRRSRPGSISPVSGWRLRADHLLAPIRMSVTTSDCSQPIGEARRTSALGTIAAVQFQRPVGPAPPKATSLPSHPTR